MNNKTKTVLALLVLLNIVLMVFLYLGKPERGNHKSPQKVIIEKLGLDDNQVKEYEALITEHQEATISLSEEIKVNKTALYQGIANNNKSFIDSIIDLLGVNFKEMEQTHFNHFLEIKNLCKEEQKENFFKLSKELPRIFSPHKRRPRRRD